MKKIRLVLLVMLLSAGVRAQKSHFIAIQSENKRPFYAKANGLVLNSTATGHLIISRLVDSTYLIRIGFSKSPIAEQQFSLKVSKDAGFILRIGKDKNLFLANSQTAQAILPVKQSSAELAFKDSAAPGSLKDNSFAKLMSRVVNDSAVMENMVVEEPAKEVARTEAASKLPAAADSTERMANDKKELAATSYPIKTNASDSTKALPLKNKKMLAKNQRRLKTQPATDSVAALASTQKKPASTESLTSQSARVDSPAANPARVIPADSLQKKIAGVKKTDKKSKLLKPAYVHPVVTKLSEQQNDSSLALVYESLDRTGVRDTVQIFIALDTSLGKRDLVKKSNRHENPETESKKSFKSDSESANAAAKNIAITDTSRSVTTENHLDRMQPSNPSHDTLAQDTSSQSPLFRPVILNNNCKSTATDYDVDKLRVKMLAIEDEDDRVSSAKKTFKSKCFSTNQIKALSEVFNSDAGKYKLFDAAYSYVYDISNFASLQSLLKDDYYRTRFKAMLR